MLHVKQYTNERLGSMSDIELDLLSLWCTKKEKRWEYFALFSLVAGMLCIGLCAFDFGEPASVARLAVGVALAASSMAIEKVGFRYSCLKHELIPLARCRVSLSSLVLQLSHIVPEVKSRVDAATDMPRELRRFDYAYALKWADVARELTVEDDKVPVHSLAA